MVTLSKSFAERLELTEAACADCTKKPRSVGKSWEWYQVLSKSNMRTLQKLAAQEKITVETVTRNLSIVIRNPYEIKKLLNGQHMRDLSVEKRLKASSLI